MISSREEILNDLKAVKIKEVPLPDLGVIETFKSTGDLLAQFGSNLKVVGGKAVEVNNESALENLILEQGVKSDLSNAICLVPSLFDSSLREYSDLTIPALSRIDYGIIEAEFGVAENGAVWIQEPENAHRSVLFIVQHLIVILDRAKIVGNMHEAYEKLEWRGSTFGVFISGPSKTADIEQSLVIGAHGPRSHVVYLV